MSPPSVSESTSPNLPPQRILVGQKALVMGANSGIGRGVALALGLAGADVIVNYIDDIDAADAVVDEIRASGAHAIAIKADVSSEQQVSTLFAKAIQQFGTLDILVNNAGCNATQHSKT